MHCCADDAAIAELQRPLLHFMQAETVDAARIEDQVPALHLVQLIAETLDHEPALQVKHCETEEALELDDQVPALHRTQDWRSDEPTIEDHVPSLQLIH